MMKVVSPAALSGLVALCTLIVPFTSGCSGDVSGPRDGGALDGDLRAPTDGASDDDDARTSGADDDAGVSGPADGAVGTADASSDAHCTTTITYGANWIRPDSHASSFDRVDGDVTWDGACTTDGANSYATLSNGWRPYFTGRSGCVIAIDKEGRCTDAPTASCTTRITYGASWLAPSDHAARYDDAPGAVMWNGECRAAGADSSAALSNGWVPHFAGRSSCTISLRFTQCGGLYANPVVPEDCPDPGVLRDGDRYVMACTGGHFALRTSPDLVHWTRAGTLLASTPAWATRDFWAPEIHRVGDRFVAYYSARAAADGRLSLGAATADDALGPYTDLGHPLLSGPRPGVIDAHHFEAPDGRHYLVYKVDGNDVGARTPILIQELAPDGVTLRGTATEILTNDRSWEGALVEGPWMIHEGDYYYLFYSANAYYDARYATGVARSRSPLGPFTKAAAPIVTSNSTFSGPGHGSVVRGPSGGWVFVYHAWRAGHERADPGRVVLVDPVRFVDGWPTILAAPNARSQPTP